MSGVKLSRTKRAAAHKVLLFSFAVTEQVVHSLYFNIEAWENTFTEQEREYLKKLQANLHTNAEGMRKLAWRLHRT